MSNTPRLFLVQSPLQALNAFEAQREFADGRLHRDVLVVFDRSEVSNNRIVVNTLRHLNWAPSLVVPFRASNAAKTLEWLRLWRFLARLPNVSDVFIGEYTAGMLVAAANLFPQARKIVLDDGTSSINFPALRYEGRRSVHLPKAKSAPFLRYRTDLPPVLTLFSIYNVALQPPDQLHPNRLKFLKSAFSFDDFGPVFFIGSCLPDVEVIQFEEFFAMFRAIRERFKGRRIVYFPHRRELLDRKRDCFRELAIEVRHVELPFELTILDSAERPSCIATFYSTAFDTLRLIGAGAQGRLISYFVPPEIIRTEADKEIARHSYGEYERSGHVVVIRDSFPISSNMSLA